VANCLAADGGTPSPVGVVLNLAQSPEPDVIGVKSVVVDDLPDLVGLDLFDGGGTIPIRTADLQDVAVLDGGDDVSHNTISAEETSAVGELNHFPRRVIAEAQFAVNEVGHSHTRRSGHRSLNYAKTNFGAFSLIPGSFSSTALLSVG